MSSQSPSTSLKRAIENMPTTELVRLAETPSPSPYYPTSLANRSTSSLIREVNDMPTSVGMFTSPMTSAGYTPTMSSTSIAMSLGQCPVKQVYDHDTGSCISVHSHKFANKALQYALFRANQKH